MIKESQPGKRQTVFLPTPASIRHRKRDLVVLRYMAHRVRMNLYLLEPEALRTLPIRYVLEERHNRVHRMVLFDPLRLSQSETIAFVGFVSRRRTGVDPEVEAQLGTVDAQLVSELCGFSGFLGYSSLELHAGHWYNLVLLEDFEQKSHLLNSRTHQYAAQQLAPRYYEWIRLHSGHLPGGLPGETFDLKMTKHYQFPGGFLGTEYRQAE